MSINRIVARALCALAGLALSGAALAGDLNPPPGPIEPTMLSLDAIESRDILKTYFGSGTAVHLITQPAHIVLTEDVSVPAGKSGIVVELPPGVTGTVSIDMNGFSIIGQPGSVHAVHVTAGSSVYFLCYSVNGDTTWQSMGGSGLRVDGALSVSVSGVVVRQCGGDGIVIVGAETCDIAADVHDCAGDGMQFLLCPTVSAVAIKVKGTGAEKNRVSGCGGNGILVLQCDEVSLHADVHQCGLDGVRVEDAARCDLSVSVVGAGGNGITVLRCPDLACGVAINTKGTGAEKNRVVNTGGNGLHIVDCGTVSVAGMSARSCQGDGLHISGASSVSVTDWRDDDCDGDGIEIAAGLGTQPRVELRDAFSNNAGANGMRITCSIGRIELARCTGATLHGMDIDCDDLVLSECTSSNNGQTGMTARIRKGMQDIKSLYNDNGWQGALLLPALGSVQEKAKQSGCSARGNGFSMPGGGGAGFEFSGISSVSMHECDSSGNAGSGVVIGDLDRDGRLDLVTCSSNGLYGVHVPAPTSGLPNGRLTATGVLCDCNGIDGMLLSGTTGGQVSECVFSSNGGLGLHVIGTSHIVRSNSCTSNGGGALFVIVPGNVVGPLIDELSVAGNCNPAANYVY